MKNKIICISVIIVLFLSNISNANNSCSLYYSKDPIPKAAISHANQVAPFTGDAYIQLPYEPGCGQYIGIGLQSTYFNVSIFQNVVEPYDVDTRLPGSDYKVYINGGPWSSVIPSITNPGVYTYLAIDGKLFSEPFFFRHTDLEIFGFRSQADDGGVIANGKAIFFASTISGTQEINIETKEVTYMVDNNINSSSITWTASGSIKIKDGNNWVQSVYYDSTKWVGSIIYVIGNHHYYFGNRNYLSIGVLAGPPSNAKKHYKVGYHLNSPIQTPGLSNDYFKYVEDVGGKVGTNSFDIYIGLSDNYKNETFYNVPVFEDTSKAGTTRCP